MAAGSKTVADLISASDPSLRQPIIDDLMSEIARFEAEDTGVPSEMRH
jgi:hypothetical protein